MPRNQYTLVNRTGKPEIILQVRYALCAYELAACWYNILMLELNDPQDVIQLARITLPTKILGRIKEFLASNGKGSTVVRWTQHGERVDLQTVDMLAAIFEDRLNFRSVA